MSITRNWHQLDINNIFERLKSGPGGIRHEEALSRRAQYGANTIKTDHAISPFFLFLDQFKDFLIFILILATVVSFIIGETLDAFVILGTILLSALLGFFQEYRSEKAVEALKKLASPLASVIREGEEHTIPAEEVVPGDSIRLQTGDLVPADARAFETHNLMIDESILTGESAPVSKHTQPIPSENIPIGDRENMLFASTIVTHGRGLGIVTETGMDTEFGKIANLLREIKSEKTPLEIQMNQIGKWLGISCLLACSLAFLIGIARGHSFLEMFIWGVSLAVAAVPESLPAVVTSALAIGVQKMAKQKAIVKRLAAVETLGCTTVICSDKTGTLTKNEMTIQEIWVDRDYIQVTGAGYTPVGEFMTHSGQIDPMKHAALKRCLELSILCNDAVLQERNGEWRILGDPTEGALLAAGAKGGIDSGVLKGEKPRKGEIPFEEGRKMMSTIHQQKSGKDFVAVKGAPDVLIRLCTHIQAGNSVVPITDAIKNEVLSAQEEMAKRALRVLALAWREIPEQAIAHTSGVIEKELTFCGLVGMIDPPRDEVRMAVKDCATAGIKSVIVTGDHLLTAQAIARAVGIIDSTQPDEDEHRTVLESETLDSITDKELEDILPHVRIFARVSPEHKLRIVEAYQRLGEVVAVTGDGVNDAPALKKADIGVAMGIKGTDVSREAADMVLADDNFATIVKAVKEGRAAYENIKKYLLFLLSCNIGEILILAGAVFLKLPLPLIALQILWVNLTTDGLPALALGIDPPEPDIMSHPPRGEGSSIFTPRLIVLIMTTAIYIFFILLGIFHHYLKVFELQKAQTMVFLTIILLEMFNAFNCRSLRYSILEMTPWQNKWLIPAVATSMIMTIMAIHLPFMNKLFHTIPLGISDWLTALLLSSSIVVVMEIVKRKNKMR